MRATIRDRPRSRRPRTLRLALLAVAGASLATAPPVAATAGSTVGPTTVEQVPDEPVDCLGAVEDGLDTFEPPYPAVVVFHGGAANSSLYWWASQPLAEAGYLVVAFDSPAGPTMNDASTVVDWLHGDDPIANAHRIS